MTSTKTSSPADLSATPQPGPLDPLDTFARRHLGPTPAEEREMLAALGCRSMADLIDAAIPAGIRLRREYGIGDYERSFRLGDEFDASQITADYRRGVLTIRVPRLAAVRPRKVEVRSGS